MRHSDILGPLIRLLAPPRCAACGYPLDPGQTALCENCQAGLGDMDGPCCPVCGQPGDAVRCPGCRRAPPPFREARAAYPYGGIIAEVLRAYKYGGRMELARPLAELLHPFLGAWGLSDPARSEPGSWLVGVPASRASLCRRGFDPVQEILRALPPLPGLERAPPRWLTRIDRRPPQASLSPAARATLDGRAFRWAGPARGASRTVILVDDVYTTGATLRACATALRFAGIESIRVIALARVV